MSYTRLSELLAPVDPAKQFAVYKRFKAAVREGELSAVPTDGDVTIARKKSPLFVPEHLIEGESQKWLASVLASFEKPRAASRRLSVPLSDLESGKVSFSEAARRYRASLQPKPKTRSRRPKEE